MQVGLSAMSIYNILEGRNGISEIWYCKNCLPFPEVSYNFIQTGRDVLRLGPAHIAKKEHYQWWPENQNQI
jgi:hypothetical protein